MRKVISQTRSKCVLGVFLSERRAVRTNKATLRLQLIVTTEGTGNTEGWQKEHQPLAAVARRAENRINYQPSTLPAVASDCRRQMVDRSHVRSVCNITLDRSRYDKLR